MDSKVYSLGAYRTALKEKLTSREAVRFSANIAKEMIADGDMGPEARPAQAFPAAPAQLEGEPLAVTILRAFIASEDVAKAAKAVKAVAEKPQEKGWFGSKYDKDMDIAETAKRVRADIKAGFPGVKVSVKISRYAGGRSMTLRVTGLPKGMYPLNPQRVVFEAQSPNAYPPDNMPRYTAAASKLLSDLSAVVDAYRRDQSDIQTDYFSVNFYSDVGFSHDLEAAHRHAIREELAS